MQKERPNSRRQGKHISLVGIAFTLYEKGLSAGSCYERKMSKNSCSIEAVISRQRELDRARLDSEWQNLVTEAGGGERGEAIAAAIKQLYPLYTPVLTDWFRAFATVRPETSTPP